MAAAPAKDPLDRPTSRELLLATRLSVAAWSLDHTPLTREALMTALAGRESAAFTDPARTADPVRALGADGSSLAGVAGDAAQVWDARTGRPDRRAHPAARRRRGQRGRRTAGAAGGRSSPPDPRRERLRRPRAQGRRRRPGHLERRPGDGQR
ncbi:hypothetical protein AB0L44_32770 [Nonomuraea wenchangensis]|uniref:hypothetical protein n=1 Tax=Nonomuraea wenchangensis TaxID=568860 RepID=UPI0034272333